MSSTINAKERRASLPNVVQRATRALEDEPLFKAAAVGRSTDRRTASRHDEVLYPR